MKKSIVLLEVILSLLLFSIIAIVSSKMLFTLISKNNSDTFIVENNLILETTRLFLTKKNDLTQLVLNDSNLYFNNNLLLENISKYNFSKKEDIVTIDICINKNATCQVWKLQN